MFVKVPATVRLCRCRMDEDWLMKQEIRQLNCNSAAGFSLLVYLPFVL